MTAAHLRFAIVGPSGRQLVAGVNHAQGTVAESGWHLARVDADAAATGSADYELSVTYFGAGR
jgi:hypothetical protein